jgi:hypothetical protein
MNSLQTDKLKNEKRKRKRASAGKKNPAIHMDRIIKIQNLTDCTSSNISYFLWLR